MDAELTAAINSLRKKRGEVAALLQKYDDAIASIAELDRLEASPAPRPKVGTTAADRYSFTDVSTGAGGALVTAGVEYWKMAQSSRSVLSKVKALLEEGPRAWTAAEIIEQYQQRNDPLRAADPGNAIRTAFSTLLKRGEALRVKEGVYCATKFKDFVIDGGVSIIINEPSLQESEAPSEPGTLLERIAQVQAAARG